MFGKRWIWEDLPIFGISDNSQKIKPGYLFIAEKGEKKDGIDFLDEAIKNGAVAVLSYKDIDGAVPVVVSGDILGEKAEIAKRFYQGENQTYKLIGVTGTNGKTTVTHLIKEILEKSGKKVGLIGTNGVFFGNVLVKTDQSTPTTPNSLELWKIIGKLSELGAEYIVMEVSSHALCLGRVLGCRFSVGVFTNLTRDHLDFHKTMEEYGEAKKKLFEMSDAAVINIDDWVGATIYGNFKNPKISVGFSDATISAGAMEFSDEGLSFLLESDEKTYSVKTPLVGKFNVYNILLALGTAKFLGVEVGDSVRFLENISPIKGRMEKVENTLDFSVYIDYAHTPDGLEKVIHSLKGFSKGRVIVVFGCGGERDRKKRAIMGEISGKYADFTIITSDNPRGENPMRIIEDIYEGMIKTKGRHCIIPDRRSAIEFSLAFAKTGDTLLIAGKGQEEYQIIGVKKLPFDEREIVRQFISKIKG